MTGTAVFPRASGRTLLAFLALLSLILGTMALVIAQPTRAATVPAVLALQGDLPERQHPDPMARQ